MQFSTLLKVKSYSNVIGSDIGMMLIQSKQLKKEGVQSMNTVFDQVGNHSTVTKASQNELVDANQNSYSSFSQRTKKSYYRFSEVVVNNFKYIFVGYPLQYYFGNEGENNFGLIFSLYFCSMLLVYGFFMLAWYAVTKYAATNLTCLCFFGMLLVLGIFYVTVE